ncbi:MAG: hypothetical protein WCV86_01600 [Patescibacteria group bacterium]|jgi:hypothetical protein
MRFVSLLVLVVLALCAQSADAGMVANTKLAVHETAPVSPDSSWQVAAWMLLPDMDSNPTTMVAVVGPRYQAKTWWLEFNLGAFVADQHARGVIDIRAAFSGWDPLFTCANVQSTPELGSWYFYADLDRKLPYGRIGIETEDRLPQGKDDYSAGVHVVLPFKGMCMYVAYQRHFLRRGDEQLWIRAILLTP